MSENVQNWIGKPKQRYEDVQLLKGDGKYIDDINIDGQLYLRVVRSSIARASIKSIDTTEAESMDGVVAVYSAKDFTGMFNPISPAAAPSVEIREAFMPLMADKVVSFVGEPVAAVIAESKAQAEDAAEMVYIDYEPLKAVVDTHESLAGDILVHENLPDNILMRWEKQSEDFESVMAGASRVIEGEFKLPRLVAAPIEPRGCIVSYDRDTESVTMWVSSQDPNRPGAQLAHMFGIAPESITVIVPEVGGAFGSKGGSPQEYLLAFASSRKLGRPIKWIEDRSENFTSSYQGRGIEARVRLAIDENGKFIAIEADLLADLGAYFFPSTPIPPFTCATMMTGAYRIESAKVTLKGVATNKVPTGPYRGAGRPEACYFVERMVELAARETGIDPIELRLRNLLYPGDFPYKTPLGQTYDSGNYEPTLIRAHELLSESSPDNSSLDKAGVIRAVGIAMSVEPAGSGFWESGGIEILPAGEVIATSGSSAHGQGHKTSFAQILADHLGVDIDSITIRQGDSRYGPGVGTFGSRSMLLGGEALVMASQEIKEMAVNWAEKQLEAAKEDLVWDGERIHVQGSPEPSLSIFEIAGQMQESGEGIKLESKTRSNTPGPTFPFAGYGAEVEIDTNTGLVKLKRMIAIDDAGTIINPLLAEGQIIGGTMQGAASALFEEMIYDSDGVPMTSSFLDYLIPSAVEADFESNNEFFSTPTPYTQLGAKGVGESGTVGALAAISNAVNAGLAELGFVGHLDPPYSPSKIWATVQGLSK